VLQVHLECRAVAGDVVTRTSLTEAMFDQMAKKNKRDQQAGGAGGSTTLQDLRNMDKIWYSMRHSTSSRSPPEVVSTSPERINSQPEWDVIVCGGTLGIFLATALQRRGLKVAVLERGKLQGRAQEWNVSRAEMKSLVQLGVLGDEDLEKVVGLEFNPVRVGFKVLPTQGANLDHCGTRQ
jgi:hypothetical protein